MPARFALLALFVLAMQAHAQQAVGPRLHLEPTLATVPPAGAPQSAWLDLRQITNAHAKAQAAPAWVESVTLVPGKEAPGQKSVFRIRIQRPNPECRVLLFRLFFDDKAQQPPELVAWDESGTQILRSGPLGAGLNIATSDTMMVPMVGVSCIDVEVPGDGATVRGAYLDWLANREVLHPIHAEQHAIIPEPFAAAAPLHSSENDAELYGTVTAPLAQGTITIGIDAARAGSFQFGVEAKPLLALLTFEVASPEVEQPPQVFLNGQDIGGVNLTLPDLADPGYRGQMEALVRNMRFQYTGWVRAQKLVPVSALRTGLNDLLVTSGGAPMSAIRATQIQLKYLWDKSDYLLRP